MNSNAFTWVKTWKVQKYSDKISVSPNNKFPYIEAAGGIRFLHMPPGIFRGHKESVSDVEQEQLPDQIMPWEQGMCFMWILFIGTEKGPEHT